MPNALFHASFPADTGQPLEPSVKRESNGQVRAGEELQSYRYTLGFHHLRDVRDILKFDG